MQAVPYHQVSSEGHTLEGAISDGKGNLLFCDVTRREVLRLDASRKASVLVHFDTVAPGGLALHKDGRLFIAAINLAITLFSGQQLDFSTLSAPIAQLVVMLVCVILANNVRNLRNRIYDQGFRQQQR